MMDLDTHDLDEVEPGHPTADSNLTTNRKMLKRERPYRGSMQDSSMDDAYNELERIKNQKCTSPSTKRIAAGVAEVFRELREMKDSHTTHAAFTQKQRELLRSEQVLADIFHKDEKYDTLSISYGSMLNAGKILNFGDYHAANLSMFKAVARKIVVRKEPKKFKTYSTASIGIKS
jgi:hypothetical protein